MEQLNVTDPALASPAGEFPLQARRELRIAFAYLRAPERGDYYQAIVRVFLKNARRYYKIYLTVEQVAADLAALYGDYPAEKCRSDLDQLVDWGNVVKTFDTGQRHTSIDSFLHPTVLYRATPSTLEIEETFLRLERQTETTGELRRGDLDHLLELFRQVDELVAAAMRVNGSVDRERESVRGQELAETWRRLADQARMILDNTSKYIHALAIARQEVATSEIEGYVRYKQQVVDYVQDFAMALERVSAQLQRLFRTWESSGAAECILTALADHGAMPFLEPLPPDDRRRDAASQIGAVADWFRGPEWVDYFGKAARYEVNAVLQKAQLLAATSHLGAGFLNDLEALARKLLRTAEVEAAAQSTAVALAHRVPRLLAENLSASSDEDGDPWDGNAQVAITLQTLQRSGIPVYHEAAPVRDRQATEELRQAELVRRRERVKQLDRLFGEGDRAISAFPVSDESDVFLVVEVLRQCLLAVGYRWRAEDGSTVSLLNPTEPNLAVLRGPRGRYILPHYVFRRAVGDRQAQAVRVVG